jgi:hypothetical protein
VSLPAAGGIEVVEVSPANGALNVSTEPVITVRLAQPCPFTASELSGLLQITPGVALSLSLSADLRTVTAVPQAPFPAGATVGVKLQKFPGATAADGVSWSFSVLPESAIRRTLAARVIGSPAQLLSPGAQATPLVLVTNGGNVPARVTLVPASVGTNGVSVGLPSMPGWIAPGGELAMPVSLLSTGEFKGSLMLPVGLSELTMGSWTSVWITASVSTRTSPPTVRVVASAVEGKPFTRHYEGTSTGGSVPTTLARVNGGSWWVVSYAQSWSLDVGFSAEADQLEIMAVEENRLNSAVYSDTFRAPPLELAMGPDRSLFWDAQLGRTYSLEWSEDLVHWTPVAGTALQTGTRLTVSPGTNPVQIGESFVGRVTVTFAPSPELNLGTNAFLRVKSNR